jgi:hypothetical protein
MGRRMGLKRYSNASGRVSIVLLLISHKSSTERRNTPLLFALLQARCVNARTAMRARGKSSKSSLLLFNSS